MNKFFNKLRNIQHRCKHSAFYPAYDNPLCLYGDYSFDNQHLCDVNYKDCPLIDKKLKYNAMS